MCVCAKKRRDSPKGGQARQGSVLSEARTTFNRIPVCACPFVQHTGADGESIRFSSNANGEHLAPRISRSPSNVN